MNYEDDGRPHPHHHHGEFSDDSFRRPGTPHSQLESVVSSRSNQKNHVVLETMSAPGNPCCAHARGVCCLLLLINLGLILVTLGFSIVLQLQEYGFVWYCGTLFLVFGFVALLASLLFTVSICREESRRRQLDNQPTSTTNGHDPIYWTHHWQKRLEI